jgi:disulfide bond formation protein DsbB
MLHIIMFVCFLGLFIKLFRPSEANVLFDGGSLIMYVIGAGVYISNIVKGLRAVSRPGGLAGLDGDGGMRAAAASAEGTVIHEGPFSGEVVLSREDSLRVLSASHVILALVLVGILVLQAGQWYAERKDADDLAKLDREALEKKAAAAVVVGKKKL